MGNFIKQESFLEIVDYIMESGGVNQNRLQIEAPPSDDHPRKVLAEARELIRELKRMKKW